MPGNWTPEDDRQLWALRATGARWCVVAKKLNRSEGAVIGRAAVLRRRRHDADSDLVTGNLNEAPHQRGLLPSWLRC